MRSPRPLRIGSFLSERLQGRSGALEPLAVFDRHAYLLTSGPDPVMLMLTREDEEAAPLALSLAPWLRQEEMRRLSLSDGALCLEGAILEGEAEIRPSALPDGSVPDAQAIGGLKGLLCQQQHASTLLHAVLACEAVEGFDLDCLRDGLATQDCEGLGWAAAQLAGLGRGLTPEGDDLLAGAMIACHLCGLEALPFALLSGAEERTTTLSLQLLRATAAGHLPESWLLLAEELRRGDVTAFTLRTILSRGASSGGDMLAGCLLGLEVIVHGDSPEARERRIG